MIETVCCPWCEYTFNIEVPCEEDVIQCKKCYRLCDLWADGDIDYDGYYLTKKIQEELVDQSSSTG